MSASHEALIRGANGELGTVRDMDAPKSGREAEVAKQRFARQFLVGLRCLAYESRWPALDPSIVPLRLRDKSMRELQNVIAELVEQDDWSTITRHLRELKGPTAAHLAQIAREVSVAKGN